MSAFGLDYQTCREPGDKANHNLERDGLSDGLCNVLIWSFDSRADIQGQATLADSRYKRHIGGTHKRLIPKLGDDLLRKQVVFHNQKCIGKGTGTLERVVKPEQPAG